MSTSFGRTDRERGKSHSVNAWSRFTLLLAAAAVSGCSWPRSHYVTMAVPRGQPVWAQVEVQSTSEIPSSAASASAKGTSVAEEADAQSAVGVTASSAATTNIAVETTTQTTANVTVQVDSTVRAQANVGSQTIVDASNGVGFAGVAVVAPVLLVSSSTLNISMTTTTTSTTSVTVTSPREAQVVLQVAAPMRPPSLPRRALRVHLVLDASTSIERHWADVEGAMRAVLVALRPGDEVQVVTYNRSAAVLVPVQSASNVEQILAATRRIRFSGGSNIEAGLSMAFDSVSTDRQSVIVLVSDGVALGGAAQATELSELVAKVHARGEARVSTVAVGDELDVRTLEAIADAGSGSFRVAGHTRNLAPELVEELQIDETLAAENVAVDLAIAPGVTFQKDELVRATGYQVELVSPDHVRIEIPRIEFGASFSIALPFGIEAGIDIGSASVAYNAWSEGLATHHTPEIQIACE